MKSEKSKLPAMWGVSVPFAKITKIFHFSLFT